MHEVIRYARLSVHQLHLEKHQMRDYTSEAQDVETQCPGDGGEAAIWGHRAAVTDSERER